MMRISVPGPEGHGTIGNGQFVFVTTEVRNQYRLGHECDLGTSFHTGRMPLPMMPMLATRWFRLVRWRAYPL